MKQYIKLLKNNYVVKKLSLIQLISYFGAWFSNVAIYTLLIKLEVSAEIIAFVAMLHFLSGAVLTPITGAIIDRFEPKKLLLILIFIEIISTFFMIFVDSVEYLYILYILIFIKMATASFYFTTEMSLLPKIVKDKELQLTNELHSIIWSFSYTAGMALSGYFVYIFGIKIAFLIDSFLFCIAFFILLNLHVKVQNNVKENIFKMIFETFIYLKSNPKIFYLMIVHAFVGFSAFDALVAILSDVYYKYFIAASLSIGLIHSFRALGLVIGPIILGKWVNKKNLFKVFLFETVAIIIWGFLEHNFYLSLVGSIFVGFFTTTLWSYTYTLIQKNTDDKFYGRVVAYNDMIFLSVASLTSYLSGYLYEQGLSLKFVTILIGISFLIGGIFYKWVEKNYNIRDI